MYHVNEFVWSPRNGHLRVVAAYIDDHLPEGQVVARQGNAVRIFDPDQPEVKIIASRPWAEGSIFPLPLEEEDLEWAFGGERNIWSTFEDVPISGGTHRWWKEMRQSALGRELLDAAAAHIEACDADPWVFGADWRHFAQFADPVDWRCYESMDPEALYALMGEEMAPPPDDEDVRL